MNNASLRFLTALPLIAMAIVIVLLGLLRLQRPMEVTQSFADLLVADGRLDDALTWLTLRAGADDPAVLRQLAQVADLAGESGQRATALQRLVRVGRASLAEHLDAARSLAAAGALKDALTVLYNAERRFPGELDEHFLSFYASLALDNGRPELALKLAQRLWKKTGSDESLKIMTKLGAG